MHVSLRILLVTGLLNLAGSGPALAQLDELPLPELVLAVEPAVVRIDVITSDGEAIGSGFVVSADGTVVTNYHVMAGARVANVTFHDDRRATVEGALLLDRDRDIAVIRISTGEYPALKLAAQLPAKGTSVAAFGAPQGLSFSATEGIVSSVRAASELKEYERVAGTWVQTSTPISPGNSGGPLVDRRGEVVGANTMVVTDGQNLNFAISSVDIADALKQASLRTPVALKDSTAKEEPQRPMASLSEEERLKVVARLADLVLIEDAFHPEVRDAARLLSLVEPKDIRDAQVRSKVARAFKKLAYESPFDKSIGVRGMARWGGRHSLPYLIELLDSTRFHFRDSEAIYDVLAASKDPQAAKAIARRLESFHDRDRALAALRRMGSAAEPGLIQAVPSTDIDVCMVAIDLLDKFGTEASLPILTEAVDKGNGNVRTAARRAIGNIRRRAREIEKAQ